MNQPAMDASAYEEMKSMMGEAYREVIAILFRALPIHVLALGFDKYRIVNIKEILHVWVSHISFDDCWSHEEKLMHSLLDSAVVPPLGNRNSGCA